MDKRLEDNFSREAIQMKTEQIKVCSTSLTTGEQRPIHSYLNRFHLREEGEEENEKNKAGELDPLYAAHENVKRCSSRRK